MKTVAFAWVLVVAVAGALLMFQLHRGVQLQTDLTALLPFEEQDATIRTAKDRVTEILTERVFLLVGDNDRANARAGGAMLAKTLTDSGMTRAVTYRTLSDSLKSLGEMYFPYRLGLLADVDRERL
jgi:predicted exporter